MKQFLITSMFTIVLAGCGGSGGSSTTSQPAPPPPATTTPDPDPVIELAEVPDYQLQDTEELLSSITDQLQGLDIEAFIDQSYSLTAAREPQALIADGQLSTIPLEELNLNDISDAFDVQTTEINALILEKLMEFDRGSMSSEDQVSYDVYMTHLQSELEAAEFRDFEYPTTYGSIGWQGQTEMFFTQVFSITDQTSAEAYLILLNQFQRRFTQIGELLESRRAAGIIEPALTLGFSQGQVNNMGDSVSTSTSYYQAFEEQVSALTNISDENKQTLMAQLQLTIEQRVLPAYQALAQQMAVVLNDAPQSIGFGQFEGADEYYASRLRYFTSSDMTADQIHQLGLDELSRIHTEMRVLFNQLGYPEDETIEQLYARVDVDGGTIAAADAVPLYEDIIATAYVELPKYFSVLPQQELVVIGGETGGYYIRGSDDGTRPGAFYASNTQDQPYTTMPTLAYHEAVPGHHLQIALANEMDLPVFRRKLNITSYVEGWALYAERLASDLGWYENDIYGDLGRLQFEAMRAARLVLDTGIHTKGWSYNESIQYHIDNVGAPGSIARYSIWPGQATAYMTGMLKILELRQLAQEQLSELYDIKDFHAAVIGSGAIPLNILEQVVNNYIANTLSTNIQ